MAQDLTTMSHKKGIKVLQITKNPVMCAGANAARGPGG